MSQNPPVFAFRKSPPVAKETYTTINLDDAKDSLEKYSKWSFIILILMFIMMIVTLFYTYKYGVPVKFKA
jgi:hypothetical protein